MAVAAIGPAAGPAVPAVSHVSSTGPTDVSGQVQAALSSGGYVETNDSYRVFAFVGGRLTQEGIVTDLTIVQPTHGPSGLKPATLPKTPIVPPVQASEPAQAQAQPTPPVVTTQSLLSQITVVEAELAAARSVDPDSPAAVSLEQQDAALHAALAQVDIAPTSYGGQAEIRGLIGDTLS
jgi:hypothetical protein